MGKKDKNDIKRNKAKDSDNPNETNRIAVINSDRCKPKKCNQECKKSCPVVRQGKLCVEVKKTDKMATISETLCIGCNICVKKCPFEAISIVNLPANLESETTHRYGANSFKLHRLPTPRPGQVLGLVGTNGIGKSTALNILAGAYKPNLGNHEDPPGWEQIIKYFRGSELQNYFNKIVEDQLIPSFKIQYVDKLAKKPMKNNLKLGDYAVGTFLTRMNAKSDEQFDYYLTEFELKHIMERKIKDLSGGELQRFACVVSCIKDADVYIFDEPSSYLDVRQRLRMARAVRSLLNNDNYVIVVEHDLAILDYMSDFICTLYGTPGAYGVVTFPAGVREGINQFLDGFIVAENMRFRESALKFKVSETADNKVIEKKNANYDYPELSKNYGDFQMTVKEGSFTDSEIIVILGENGTGKTTFVKLLAGKLQSDSPGQVPALNVSYKPQTVAPKFEGTVRQLLHARIPRSYQHPAFVSEVMKPMKIPELLDRLVKTLSGGEVQRVATVLCLGKPADIYLIDEPSAYLDAEQRLNTAKVIKRYILSAKKTAFVVEHDFIMATYMADRVVVFEGEPGVKTICGQPESLVDGMNKFLKNLGITFRRDSENYRPRINKENSQKDCEQKASGDYFFVDRE